MKKILIFCQAPADIKYALTIYERNKNDSDISIFTINVEGMHKFLKSFNLNLKELQHIQYPKYNIKNPISILKIRKYIRDKYEHFFSNRVGYHIFYFSNHFDFLTFYFLKKLSNSNSIFFVNHYDDQVSKKFKKPIFNIKDSAKMLILNSLSGCFLQFYSFDNKIIPRFPYKRFKIKELKTDILDDKVYSKYAYNIKATGKKILFLEMDYGKTKIFENYKNITIEIIKILKNKNYKIYLKPHPRVGYSKFLSKLSIKFIDDSIPAEFIDETSFDYILGISSSALADFANRKKVKVISMMNFYQYNDENTKKRAFDYLNDLSDNIYFIKELDDFDREI